MRCGLGAADLAYCSRGLCASLGYGWDLVGETSPLFVSLSMLIIWVSSWLFIVTTCVQDKRIKEWSLFHVLLILRRGANWVWGPLFLSIAGAALWQEIFSQILSK